MKVHFGKNSWNQDHVSCVASSSSSEGPAVHVSLHATTISLVEHTSNLIFWPRGYLATRFTLHSFVIILGCCVFLTTGRRHAGCLWSFHLLLHSNIHCLPSENSSGTSGLSYKWATLPNVISKWPRVPLSARRTSVLCWCPSTPTKTWRSTLRTTWSDTAESTSTRSRRTCESTLLQNFFLW